MSPPTGYIIISGTVKVGRNSADGRENLLMVAGPSDMVGELSIFNPGPRTTRATTISEVRAVSMDHGALRAWIADSPEVAEQLLRLVQQFGSQEGGALRVTHDPTQDEIAQLVGSSRQSVGRTLADFAQRDWIRLAYKSVLIVDSEHLARLAS